MTSPRIFLLPKGGDPTKPSNYRPIALLTSVYKIIATHTSNHLNEHISKPGTLSDSRFGFRRKFQTTDHSIGLASKRTLHPSSYVSYLDLSKAFNSVVHGTLFKLLAKAGFPPGFIDMIKRLYRAPLDTPRVNGYSLASHLQLRGLRKGCPLSPSPFSLYIDPLLRVLEHTIAGDPTATLHVFADDMALHSTHLGTLQAAFEVIFKRAVPYGLIINVAKSELHAWGNAPHASICVRHQGKLSPLSTVKEDGVPHACYKYLGVYFFTDYSPKVMLSHYLAVVDSFFAALPGMVFSPKEATRLVNTQLIPKLAFRMTAYSLNHDSVVSIQNRVWAHYSRVTKLPPLPSPRPPLRHPSRERSVYSTSPLG